MTEALIADAVTRRFSGAAVVDSASLTLEPGRLTALLGPSGAGKSTLLRIFAGLEPVDGGTVRLGNQVLSSPGAMVPAERRRTGLIFQDYALFPHLTALDNVLFGLNHLPRAAARQLASDWLARLSLTDRARAYPHQMSGGEQQRVAIARALAPGPDAILMDEPFSGLDPALESGVREAALLALADAGKPALLVTHDPAAAMAMADTLAVMRAGQVIQTGPPEAVYRQPVNLDVARALAPIQAIEPRACPPSLTSGLGLPEDTALLGLREEDLQIDPGAPTRAQVTAVSFLGSERRMALSLDGPSGPLTLTLRQPASGAAPAPGETIGIRLVPQGRFIFDP